ncbi:hypothetical protein ACLM5J_05720 [Nocardioides sp. Bht2]|uniref:hypothetical protein n=1 Tax=Nocardioides sp. Bht2 TaxID=3392297 RepID=UPI0039B6C149
MDSRTQLLADPFWSVVARRHPELEIVLVPGDEPDLSTPIVDADAAHVAAIAEALESQRPQDGWDGAEPPHAEVVPGPSPDSVEVRLKYSQRDADGLQTLAAMAQHADHAESRDGEVVTLRAAFDLLRLRATWARETEILVVRFTSPALRVGEELAARLLGRS